jgi:hypothetical protein
VQEPDTNAIVMLWGGILWAAVPPSNLRCKGITLFDFTSHFIHTSFFSTNLCTHMNDEGVSLRLCDVGFWIQQTARF